MSYRLVKVANFLPSYLEDYYGRHPGDHRLPYDEQWANLMSDRYGWSDYFSRHLRNLGADADEIVANALPLQRTWARQHGLGGRSGLDLVLWQLKALNPEVVFLQDAYSVPSGWIRELRKQISSLKLVLAWCCSPFTDTHLRTFGEADALLTCTPGFVEQFRERGFNTCLINHAFEKSVLEQIDDGQPGPETDIIFIGSIIAGTQFHDSRQRLIDTLLRANLDLTLYGTLSGNSKLEGLIKSGLFDAARLLRSVGVSESFIRQIPVLRKALGWDKRPESARFAKLVRNRIRAPIYGLTMLRSLSRANIGLNIHIGAAGRYAGNVRMFETTGVGTCLLTDWKENLGDLFEIDKEVVAYRSAEECLEKACWLLDHPEQRQAIARAGQKRTLQDYTFERSASILDDLVRDLLRGSREGVHARAF